MAEQRRGSRSGGVFLSYRRGDTARIAGRLYDRVEERFGTAKVFMDVEAIEPGVDFADAIENAVASCDIVLALIGRSWLNGTDRNGRRWLDDPNDFVALEIGSALRRGIPVIPVLFDGAPPPRAGDLPSALAPLALRNAVLIEHETFSADVDRLLRFLTEFLGRAENVAESESIVRAPATSRLTDQGTSSKISGGVPVDRVGELRRGHLFISYAREDDAKIRPLTKSLEEQGYHLWIDTA